MKTTLALMLLISMVPVIHGNAEKDPHHDQQVEAIASLKDRLKTLRDYIDRLNGNVCQSSVTTSPICDANDEFRKLFKCLTTPVTKRVTVDFSRDFEAAPDRVTVAKRVLSGCVRIDSTDVGFQYQYITARWFLGLVIGTAVYNVIAAGITGMSGYALNVQVSTHDIQKDIVELQIKSEDLFTLAGISTGVLSCPHGLVPGHGHSH